MPQHAESSEAFQLAILVQWAMKQYMAAHCSESFRTVCQFAKPLPKSESGAQVRVRAKDVAKFVFNLATGTAQGYWPPINH